MRLPASVLHLEGGAYILRYSFTGKGKLDPRAAGDQEPQDLGEVLLSLGGQTWEEVDDQEELKRLEAGK